VNRSAIVQMTFFFETERGNPMAKSIETKSHFLVGISKGGNMPMGCWLSAL